MRGERRPSATIRLETAKRQCRARDTTNHPPGIAPSEMTPNPSASDYETRTVAYRFIYVGVFL